MVRFRKWDEKERKALMKLTELFLDHPNNEYSDKDLQEYLKSEGIDIDERTLDSLTCDLLEMRMIAIKQYYKLDTTNPVVQYLIKESLLTGKLLAELAAESEEMVREYKRKKRLDGEIFIGGENESS